MGSSGIYTIHLAKDHPFDSEIRWVFSVFAQYAGITIECVHDVTSCMYDLHAEHSGIPVNSSFFEKIYTDHCPTMDLLDEEMDVLDVQGRKDYLGTAFYFLNCLWEQDPKAQKDHWGRSEFDGSIWKKYGHNKPFVKVNQVFNELASVLGIEVKEKETTVFLSHDIDVVYGGYLEDGFALVKKGKVLSFANYLMSHVFKGPQWFNFRKIARIEQKYGARSTFFWIPFKGKVEGVGKNADYSVGSHAIQEEIQWLKKEGFTHGIHKSISSTSFQEELPNLGFEVFANRYHYLKYSFNQLKQEVNASGLKMDASLGYAQVFGYRNGYSLPYVPFDLENRKPCTFLEVPLTLMDGTFSQYQKLPGGTALKEMLVFLEEHRTQSVLSVLWHNSHFTGFKYAGYPEAYEGFLNYLQKTQVQTCNPDQLIEQYFK